MIGEAKERRVLTYATVCSGIECMSVACRGLPLKPVFFSEIEPFPCAVLKSHYPDVPNFGDMSKIQVSNDGLCISNGRQTISIDKPIDILAGGTPCFAAGTMVLTPKGYVPIETLKVGDEVVSGSGHVRKVEAVGSKMAEVGTLKVLGRPEIVCTPNHPFLCIGMKRDNRRKSETYSQMIPVGDYEKTRADEAVGKYVGRVNNAWTAECPIAFPKCGDATVADIMELAGWYLGDGYIRRFKGKTKKSVVFALCCEKKIARFKDRFCGTIHVCGTGCGKLTVNCTALADWLLAHFGEHAALKRIPYWCYGHENTHLLLRGYAETDGWTQGNERKFCTVSPALAYGVADLLGSASVYLQKVPRKGMIQGREINQRDYYQIKVTPKTIRTKIINGRYASIVRSYNGTDGLVRVYNITVADEHDYIANGLWSHNCQDVSVAGLRRGFDPDGRQTRSSLAFDFVRLARELRPRWVLWENVAGSIDSKNAPDFLRFASALGDCGYSLAWRILDAQYVMCEDIHAPDGRVDVPLARAVPQRRRRVWLLGVRTVGCSGADESLPAQILFEPDCAQGHTPPRRRTGQGFAYSLAGRDRVDAGMVGEPAARGGGIDAIALDGDKLKPRVDQRKGGNGFGVNGEGAGYTLTGVDRHGVAYGVNNQGGAAPQFTDETSGTMVAASNSSGNNLHGVAYSAECYENHAQDSRVQGPIDTAPTQGSSNANSVGVSGNNPLICFSKVGHAQNSEGKGEHWEESEVVGTRNAFDNGDSRSQEVVISTQGLDGYNKTLTGDCAPTISGAACDLHHTHGVISTNSNGLITKGSGEAILSDEHHMALQCGGGQCGQGFPAAIISTNSNGEDVAPTIGSDHAHLGSNQMLNGGGVHHQPHGFDISGFGYYNDSGVASTMKMRDYKDHTDVVVHEKEGAEGE